jgi:phage terminase large subunit GpA-like protein
MVSTPTLKGLSRIEAAFERTDRRYYHVPCPHCGLFQPIRWAYIRWPKGNVVMVCEGCEQEIPESHKGKMLALGRWVATAVGEPGVAGFHLSGLYSPSGLVHSWAGGAGLLKARQAGDAELKVWINTVLGETWEEKGETVDDSLFAWRENYAARYRPGPWY